LNEVKRVQYLKLQISKLIANSEGKKEKVEVLLYFATSLSQSLCIAIKLFGEFEKFY
jgi:hypothetical protein